MPKIGILQGRVLPDTIDKLQVFPGRWKEELALIKKIGFDSVEMLDDKESKFRGLEKNDLFSQIENNKLECGSICMDYLCKYSLLKNPDFFLREAKKIMSDKDLIFIIPFFDENKINSREELSEVLKILSESDFGEKNLSLEIDMPSELLKEELDNIKAKNIGICYDTGNRMGQGADLEKEIEDLADYINHVHVKYKEEGKNVRIKENSEELKKAFEALNRISYSGFLVLETCIVPVPEKEAGKNLLTVKNYL